MFFYTDSPIRSVRLPRVNPRKGFPKPKLRSHRFLKREKKREKWNLDFITRLEQTSQTKRIWNLGAKPIQLQKEKQWRSKLQSNKTDENTTVSRLQKREKEREREREREKRKNPMGRRFNIDFSCPYFRAKSPGGDLNHAGLSIPATEASPWQRRRRHGNGLRTENRHVCSNNKTRHPPLLLSTVHAPLNLQRDPITCLNKKFTYHYWVSLRLLRFTRIYWVLFSRGFIEFYCVLLGFTGFNRVLPGLIKFYWVSLGFTGF